MSARRHRDLRNPRTATARLLAHARPGYCPAPGHRTLRETYIAMEAVIRERERLERMRNDAAIRGDGEATRHSGEGISATRTGDRRPQS